MRIFFLLLISALALPAQQPPAFDAASVKTTVHSGPASGTKASRGTVEITNDSLHQLIRWAYRAPEYAISAPSWMDSLFFDVIAKLPPEGTAGQAPEMMQTLLAERFKLVVHREQREMNGLALVADKKGFHVPSADCQTARSGGPSMVQIVGGTLEELAKGLESALQRPVRDMTGVAGCYSVKIRWIPDGAGTPANTDGMSGSVYEALGDLGLKLQAQKVTVDVLVVDYAQRVPEN